MSESDLAAILSRVRRMSAEVSGASDAQLLDRFAATRDEAAFELLLWRHARLVFGVCRRVLHDVHDAEDAFQATFLALASHAGKIAKREAVAGWLHKVAYRVALTARRQRLRAIARDRRACRAKRSSLVADAEALLANEELRGVLDQEIDRLPERFRSAIVLCYLEGKSVDEAAMLLGCPRGTVASRLARARERLRVRLSGRGLVLTAALTILPKGQAAHRPLSLIASTTSAALRYTTASAGSASALSIRSTSLAEEVLRAMFLDKLKSSIAILIVCLGVLFAGGGLALGLRASTAPEADPQATGKPSERPPVGREQRDKDKPVAAEARVVAVSHPAQRQAAPYEDFAGRLEALRSVEIRATASGFVEKVCFQAGAEVQKGDVLFLLDSRAPRLALDKAKAELTLANLRKEQSDKELARARQLAQRQIALEDLERFAERAATADAAVKTARVAADRAELDLKATEISAPMAGRVGRPLVAPGDLVFRGSDRATLLTTVTFLNAIGVTFDMDEHSFLRYQRLAREQRVKGKGSSLRIQMADEKGFPHEGMLDSFEDQVNPETGTVRVRGSLSNPGHLLLPGMFARVRLAFGKPVGVLEVPEEAILTEQGKHYVLIVGNDNTAQRRAVTLGQSDNGMRIVEKGLSADDWVAISGVRDIHPGDRVKPHKKALPKRSDPQGADGSQAAGPG